MKLFFRIIIGSCLWLFFIPYSTNAQDPTRFEREIQEILSRNFERNSEVPLALFTGSSSIRFWDDLEDIFPNYQVLNHGFGGSEFTDLIHYKKELIFDVNPDYLFIYEGDNDINSGKSPTEILAAIAYLYANLKSELPNTSIYFISPKPSISRWHLKDDYIQLNELIANFCSYDDQITFIDVWNPMLDDQKSVRTDLFLEDDLHMNEEGYAIWKEIIGQYLVQN